MTLPSDLAKALAAANGEPLRLQDPKTDQQYVLIKAEIYDQLRHLVVDSDNGLTERQVAMLIQEAMHDDDQNDPLLESYQNYKR